MATMVSHPTGTLMMTEQTLNEINIAVAKAKEEGQKCAVVSRCMRNSIVFSVHLGDSESLGYRLLSSSGQMADGDGE